MKPTAPTIKTSPVEISDARLCDLAKQAFNLGLLDGEKDNAKPCASSKLNETLLPNGLKKQRKLLRKVYALAFNYNKRRVAQQAEAAAE